jgi:hypothetical protein
MHGQDAGHKTKENLRPADEFWVMLWFGEGDLNMRGKTFASADGQEFVWV